MFRLTKERVDTIVEKRREQASWQKSMCKGDNRRFLQIGNDRTLPQKRQIQKPLRIAAQEEK